MMKEKYIGNIVTTSKRPIFNKLCKICKDINDIDADNPTLIIGLDLATKFIDGFNTNEKTYNDDMIMWTYRKMESRDDYERDLEEFYQICYKRIIKNIKYTFFDLLNYHFTKKKKIINFFKSDLEKYCFLTKDSNFCFVYCPFYKTVFGLSLTFLEYVGIPKEKVKAKIKENKNNIFIYTTDFMDSNMYKIIGNKIHYIPVIATYFEK